jgi:dipeptidyl-peptidase-4
VADYYIIDTMRHTRKQLGEGKVRDAVMSPNGRYVAFAKDNNLYIHKLDFGTEVAVTKDENTEVINGIADWLYEEEFATTALFAWSPDSKMLAFVRLDETEVPTFSWDVYSDTQYPKAESLRYPKAGCPNAKVSVCVYDIATKGIQRLQVESGDVYLPRLRWTDENTLLVLRVNRDQTKMEVLSCNAKSTVCHPLYAEESKKYFVDYSLFDEWQWLSDGKFIVLSEKNGWRQAYLYSSQGVEQKVLTPEGIDVTAVYGVNEKTQTLYYQAAPQPSTRHIYALNIKKGEISQLTKDEGMWSARFNSEATKAVFCYQSFETPNTYYLYSKNKLELLEDNAEVKAAWQANGLPEPEMMQINGLEAMLLRSPVTGNPSPLILMHYSGPSSQRVLNRWRKRFEYDLVEQGYAVLIVDTRGSDCKGRAWRNETYMSLGQKEAEDLIMAANEIAKRPDIDGERMAIMGWSYGGYETLFTMSQKNNPFKCAVAIAPVTDWKLYDSAYTERYMRRPQVNPRGYDEASLLNKAKDLTGKVLIIHGTADDNVHVQHTMQYIDALVRADKQFEMQLYPDDNHFLRKGNNAKHMHNRVIQFLQNNLKQ